MGVLGQHVRFDLPDDFLAPSVETSGQIYGIPPSLDDKYRSNYGLKRQDTLVPGADVFAASKTPHVQPITQANSSNRPDFDYVDRVFADHAKWLLAFEASKSKAPVQYGALCCSDPMIGNGLKRSSKDVPYCSPGLLGVPMTTLEDTSPLLHSSSAVDRVLDHPPSSENKEATCSVWDLLAFSLKTAREQLFYMMGAEA